MNSSLLIRIALFATLATGLGAAWWYIDKTYFPKPVPPTPPEIVQPESMQALAGVAATVRAPAKVVEPPKPETPKPQSPEVKPSEPTILVALGNADCFQQILLSNRGAAIQQAILPKFDESTRGGRDAKDGEGKNRRLHLIPGFHGFTKGSEDRTSIFDDNAYPGLRAGPIPRGSLPLAVPSYTLSHYPSAGDKLRRGEDSDSYPSNELAERVWAIVEQVPSVDGSDAKVVFETILDAPYFLKIRKTFTLGPKDYHVGMKLDFEALPGRPKDKDRARFKYQISGALGLPVEGEWYTSTYRNALIGWMTPAGTAKRDIQDSASVTTGHGGNKIEPQGNTFTYAGVGTQYFASVLAIDDAMPDDARKNLWSYVRPSREPLPSDLADKPALGDITVRAVANPIDPQDGKPVSHSYVIYNGPMKVRLLNQLGGDRAVDPALTDRYLDKLTLKTLADYHSPNFFGRLANSIWWSDIVIWMTNRMHGILGFLHDYVPIWGLDILLLTVMVRMLLFVPSRKQQQVMAKTQEKMALLKPEIAKLEEKHKGDYQRFNQERTKLMVQNGVNPLSSMSGCILMFAQLPVFMGLYFCLQESIFFRLESFLWMPNLAAPDMLVKFGEGVPFISDFSSLGGTVYLGPYLNILPLIAVTLMFIHQKLTMPPPTDEQQEMQQRMMKIMMLVMAVFFYKMAAGMCLYFIASTSWGLTEKWLIKRKKGPGSTVSLALSPVTPSGGTSTSGAKQTPPTAPVQGTGFMARMKAKMEEIQQQSETQRQIRNDPKGTQPGANGTKPNGKKKKKK